MSAPGDLRRLDERQTLLGYVREVWRRREFATALAVSELRSQNQDTALGQLWHLLNPLLLMGIYYLVFGLLLDVSRGVDNFLAFLAVGVFIFHYSQKTITGGAKSVVGNVGLIRSISFPRALLPLSSLIGQTLAFLPAIVLMLMVAVGTGEQPQVGWLLLVPVLVLQALFNLGSVMVAARLTDAFHDLQQLLPYVFRLLFYMSGVLYEVSRWTDDPTILALFDANPFYAFITLARDVVFHGTVGGTVLVSAVLWTVLALVVGFAYFRAGEQRYGRG